VETTEIAIEEEMEMEIGKTRTININKKVMDKKVAIMITNMLKRDKVIISREEITKIEMIIIEMIIVAEIEVNHEEITKVEAAVIKVARAV